ncbi:hypothetical protein PGH47_42275 (plasmid) [Streptomyces sp. HUAS 31]|uniref:hypothetical protein n=1 Tax=Streptomyces sp. HUAS 31 TaxID=3020055 RepID=UPI00230540A3|nr:hypothetical protein [Streptomyces sp. HUAS 31]WCE02381.1 hypothetical protein PGH47_42275 [Streptomyces sp. HUAS 31]
MRGTPQHLLAEDRPEYERLLDEALRSAPHRPELAAVGRRLNTEQLRTMALNATALITAAAATEYQDYVAAREELRDPVMQPQASAHGVAVAAAGTVRVPEPPGAGAGAAAVVAVLSPVLAGTAATIFLGVGYLLELVGRASSFSGGLITTGWIFGAVTAAAILVAAAGLVLNAVRNGTGNEAETPGELSTEVSRARDAWHAALLERGIIPFLRDSLADSNTTPTPHRAASPRGRMPYLGHSRPGFSSSEDDAEPQARPRFTGPDFTSPDYGGPEHDPE